MCAAGRAHGEVCAGRNARVEAHAVALLIKGAELRLVIASEAQQSISGQGFESIAE